MASRRPGPGFFAPAGLSAALSVVLLAGLLAATAGPAAAQGRQLSVESWSSDVRVYRTAAVEVSEHLTYRFQGSWNGVYRDVRVSGERADGSRWRIFVDVESVTDGEGEDLRWETSREGEHRRIKVWVPEAEDATRTVVFRYRVEGALQFHRSEDEGFEGEEFDELFWNVTGHASEIPIRSASATVHLPAEVEGVRGRAWQGPFGSRQEARVEVRGTSVEAGAVGTLEANEGLSVAVAWDAGVVERPGPVARTGLWLRQHWYWLLPFAALLLMWRIWSARGKDPERRSVAARYEPPDGLTAGEVGVLIDHTPDMRDITATLVSLAVKGHLVIEETEEEKLLGLASDTSYTFERRTEPDAWDDLQAHERRLMIALFDAGAFDRVDLSELEDEFYEELPDLRDALFRRLLDDGYYERRPDKVRGAWMGGAVVATVVLIAAGLWLGRSLGLVEGAVLGGSVGAGLVVAGFGWFMPARTRKGARALEGCLGFEEFLERVEEDRFRRMIEGPEDFERYLPYAMALQVEKKWAEAFEDLYTEPPEWYRGSHPDGFRTGVFVASLNDMSTRTTTAMSSSPRGSGGSGFSGGGGMAGGGVGGGGTGGF